MILLAIDPGDRESGYVILTDDFEIIDKGKVATGEMLSIVNEGAYDELAIEMIQPYGMAVGKSVFETCVNIGRFIEAAGSKEWTHGYYRKTVVAYVTGSGQATDTDVRRSLARRFTPNKVKTLGKGTKANPGYFYGFHDDIWQAMAVGVYHLDMQKRMKAMPHSKRKLEVMGEVFHNGIFS